jgi:hypothetical protein
MLPLTCVAFTVAVLYTIRARYYVFGFLQLAARQVFVYSELQKGCLAFLLTILFIAYNKDITYLRQKINSNNAIKIINSIHRTVTTSG